jgi:hypothetical protein
MRFKAVLSGTTILGGAQKPMICETQWGRGMLLYVRKKGKVKRLQSSLDLIGPAMVNLPSFRCFSETLHPARWLDDRLVQLARMQRPLRETAPASEPTRNSARDFEAGTAGGADA